MPEGGTYSSERLYAVLRERDKLLEEADSLRESLKAREEAQQSLKDARPTYVEDLSECRLYEEQLESLAHLNADSGSKRERLREVENEIEAIPERMLSESVIPEGLWVRYGDRGVRIDRSTPASGAEISEYSWEAVENSASPTVAEVAHTAARVERNAASRYTVSYLRIGTLIGYAPSIIPLALLVAQSISIGVDALYGSDPLFAFGSSIVVIGFMAYTLFMSLGILCIASGRLLKAGIALLLAFMVVLALQGGEGPLQAIADSAYVPPAGTGAETGE